MLALIAGTGGLPRLLFETLEARGQAPVLCAAPGVDLGWGPGAFSIRLEQIAEALDMLKGRGVRQVSMAGGAARPDLDPTAVTPASAGLVQRLAQAMALGDDGTLRTVVAIFEEAGFEVVGAADLLPDLLPPGGLFAGGPLDAAQQEDARVGEATIAAMGARDQGQACVVQGGKVVAEEGPEGTDAMLAALSDQTPTPTPPDDPFEAALDIVGDALGAAADWLSGPEGSDPTRALPAEGGLLFKAPKPGQERRVDLPLIGPDTVISAATAGLSAIVIEAGGVMVLDQAQVRVLCDAHQISLWVREAGA